MIKIVDWSNEVNYKKVNGLYVIQNDVWIDFLYNDNKFRITVDAGAMTDGLSVPKIFRWYLSDWNDSNPLYNIAGICHDGAYGSELLSKDIADELFYQGLIKAGISKSKATVAKWAVEHLAGLHYGRKNDDFGISEYVSVEAL
jgi:hypothetical protein